MQVHRGVCTLKSTPKYIKHKSNCITQVHMGVGTTHTHSHTLNVRDVGNRK